MGVSKQCTTQNLSVSNAPFPLSFRHAFLSGNKLQGSHISELQYCTESETRGKFTSLHIWTAYSVLRSVEVICGMSFSGSPNEPHDVYHYSYGTPQSMYTHSYITGKKKYRFYLQYWNRKSMLCIITNNYCL